VTTATASTSTGAGPTSTKDQRFLSQDPIGFAGGDTNLHAYVGNEPTGFTDPMGTKPEPSTSDRGEERARAGVERPFERTLRDLAGL
jgi:uncharacterized protein RhaS with RHS repeats